jgi:hypothetical protein
LIHRLVIGINFSEESIRIDADILLETEETIHDAIRCAGADGNGCWEREFRCVSHFRHDDRPAKTVAKHAGSEVGGWVIHRPRYQKLR